MHLAHRKMRKTFQHFNLKTLQQTSPKNFFAQALENQK